MDRDAEDAPKGEEERARDPSVAEREFRRLIARMQAERQSAAVDALFGMTGEEIAEATSGPREPAPLERPTEDSPS